MKTSLNIPKELITHIDVMNTLNGGVTEPALRIHHFVSYREITLRVPGIPQEHIKMEINNNKLTVYYFTILKSQDMEFPFPKVVYDKVIPYFVDIHNITVREENSSMIIHLPYNELANGYKRDLSVKS